VPIRETMRPALTLIGMAFVLAACGGGGGEESKPTPAVATASEVESIIEAEENISDPYSISCVAEDSTGRRFSCLAEYAGQTTASYDVVCDAARASGIDDPPSRPTRSRSRCPAMRT
jgi:hypothetical protein